MIFSNNTKYKKCVKLKVCDSEKNITLRQAAKIIKVYTECNIDFTLQFGGGECEAVHSNR